MLEEIKRRCYITSSLYDEEIESLIEACKCDLRDAGIKKTMLDTNKNVDGQILNCVTNYVKAYRGNDRTDTDKYLLMYESLKNKISLQSEYKEEFFNE